LSVRYCLTFRPLCVLTLCVGSRRLWRAAIGASPLMRLIIAPFHFIHSRHSARLQKRQALHKWRPGVLRLEACFVMPGIKIGRIDLAI
jgi:hypothetical protein